MRRGWIAGAAVLLVAARASASPSVWVIDDGEKVKQDATSLPFERGESNPIWAPGKPAHLFALRNETVALQVVVEADEAPLSDVTVDLAELRGPDGATLANDPGATDPTKFVGRRIERFVEHYFDVARASGGTTPGASLGWLAGAAPPAGKWTGKMPDALVPVEVAKPWVPYPMTIAPGTNGVVWIDVTVPRDQKPGLYAGSIVVGSGQRSIATIPLELEVVDALLPDRIEKTMLYYEKSELDRATGAGEAAERHLWQLFHRHRLAAMHHAKTLAEAEAQLPALDGSAFTAAAGYEGPAAGVGDGVLALGAYGALGAPSEASLHVVEQIADRLAEKRLLAATDTFVYAIDEDCGSSWGAGWKRLLAASADANAKAIRVGWTCSEDPTKQPVDVVMQLEGYDAAKTAAARALGKEVWVYNGVRPYSGTFLTDAEAVGPRVNGWLGGALDIGRWFYWETTFWFDDNKGGKGPYDPFVQPETFHNADGDWCEGDGVLVYPGTQTLYPAHSLGMAGVVASIRLKNWRRGIEDAGYFQLARAADAAKADAIVRALVPRAMSGASGAPSWSDSGQPFFEARKALLALVPRGKEIAPKPVGSDEPAPLASGATAPSKGCGCRPGCAKDERASWSGAALAGLAACVLTRRRRSRVAARGARPRARGAERT